MNDAAVDAALAMFERMLHPSVVPDRHAVREALREAQAHPDCPHCEDGNVWITNDASVPCDRCGGTGERRKGASS